MKASALWTSLLGAPLIYLIYLQVAYMLSPGACVAGHKANLTVVTAAALITTLALGLLARRGWQRSGGGSETAENDAAGRSRFMALMGIGASALFALVIIASGVFIFVLEACD